MAFALIICSCGHEGCIDKSAINYDSTADKDDGSCIYCDQDEKVITLLDSNEYFLSDDRFGSEHAFENVIKISVTQFSEEFPTNLCGNDKCYFEVNLENLVEEDIVNAQFSFSIPNAMGTFAQPISLQLISPVTIPSGQTLENVGVFRSGTPEVCPGLVQGQLQNTSIFSLEYL
jgi:hypothetical protein